MGRKGNWSRSIKSFFSCNSKEKKRRQVTPQKPRRRWILGACSDADTAVDNTAESDASVTPPSPLPAAAAAAAVKNIELEKVELVDVEEEQSKHAISVAVATAAAAEAAVAAAQAAAEVVRLTAPKMFAGREEGEAAVVIQSAFRGYLARRALRALKGLVRLKSLVDSNGVKHQTANTLQCMQTLSRVQLQIRSRRIRTTEENQALERQLKLKHERELEKLRIGEEWDDSLQSKEQIEASVMHKQDAAIKRERALAYAFSHQWRSSSKSMNPTFMDPNFPQWGWSWLERWVAARPWVPSTTTDDNASLKSAATTTGVEVAKSYARRDSLSPASQKSTTRPPGRRSPSAGKMKSTISRSLWDDDTRSTPSFGRRRSFGGSSVRDDDSLASSSAVSTLPSYMSPTQSAKAKSRFRSPSRERIGTAEAMKKRLSFTAGDKQIGASPAGSRERIGTAEAMKKRLSFTAGDKQIGASPAGARRHSDPPKVDVASLNTVG